MITALLELGFLASTQERKTFSCEGCRVRVQKLRRCQEDRFDFGPEDNASVFPIFASSAKLMGGYSFCPGKATWFPEYQRDLNLLITLVETNSFLKAGALEDQDDWFVDLYLFFVPLYKQITFQAKVRAVLGDSESIKKGH